MIKRFQMNVVVSLFAQENDEKRVIRFKKIPSSDTTSKFNYLFLFLNFIEFGIGEKTRL